MQIGNVINRFSWNAVLVLAMVPMIQSGCGLNFGLPLGIVSGLLGGTLSIQLGFTGRHELLRWPSCMATPFAVLLGGGYGWLLNKIKGGEMMIATYVGLSSIVIHVHDVAAAALHAAPPWCGACAGKGLRTTISLEGFYDKVLANFLADPHRPGGSVWYSPPAASAVLRSAGLR